MAAVTDVTITAGVPTAGSGTVSTLDKFDGAAGTPTSRAVTVQGNSSGTPVPASLAAETTKVIGTVRMASGGVAAGSLATGAGVDGWDLTQGANADAASLTGSISAKLRGIATALGITAFDLGQGTGGSRTLRVAIDSAQLDGSEYETVAASQTAQVLGATGATGDFISGILVIPATTSPGNVLLLDNATSITVFTGGATSVSNLVPFFIPLGMFSVSGAWKLTTGANVSCIGIGNFT